VAFLSGITLEDSRLRHTDALKRLYLIAAVALLYATTTGMTVTITGLRTNARPSLATWYKLS
jgi:hypothetical protein